LNLWIPNLGLPLFPGRGTRRAHFCSLSPIQAPCLWSFLFAALGRLFFSLRVLRSLGFLAVLFIAAASIHPSFFLPRFRLSFRSRLDTFSVNPFCLSLSFLIFSLVFAVVFSRTEEISFSFFFTMGLSSPLPVFSRIPESQISRLL